jgi:hypothetical protein
VTRETGERVGAVLAGLVRHPIARLWRRWNWKAAVLSATARAVLFFLVNLPAGRGAAVAACLTELVFRATTSGFYAAITQALGRAEPAWAGLVTAMILLPIVTHSAELAVHWLRDTARLGDSIAASVAFTAISTAFHVFAMRRGALVVGDARRPFREDLQRLPGLIVAFVRTAVAGLVAATVRAGGRWGTRRAPLIGTGRP